MDKVVKALVKMELDAKAGDLTDIKNLEEIIVNQYRKAVSLLNPENVEE